MPLLEVDDIHTAYGASQVLFGVSLAADPGEVVALLGRNGVGKSTTLRSIIGLTSPQSGSIRWKGKEIAGLQPHEINRMGIAFVPEDRRIFPELTTWENLDIAHRTRADGGGWTFERVYALFPELQQLAGRKGGYLSGGQQQMLTIARGLMGNPEMLLLDEPSEGLAPLIVKKLAEQITALQQEGLAIILAEQNLQLVLSLAQRVHILEKGQVKFTGTPRDLREGPHIVQRYLSV